MLHTYLCVLCAFSMCRLFVNCLLFFVLAYAFEGYHQRAVNKLSFHPREANILLSGSQDSCVKVFVRNHSEHCL